MECERCGKQIDEDEYFDNETHCEECYEEEYGEDYSDVYDKIAKHGSVETEEILYKPTRYEPRKEHWWSKNKRAS